MTDDKQHVIVYDDAEVKTLNMANERWRYALSAHALVGPLSALSSDEQRVLRELTEFFGNKPFLRHQFQAFGQFSLVNEENEFFKIVRVVKRHVVSRVAKVYLFMSSTKSKSMTMPALY